MFVLLPDKREKKMFVNSVEVLVFFRSQKNIMVDFEAAVVSAINKIFPGSTIAGCKFYFGQCLWRSLQNIYLNDGIQIKCTSPTRIQSVCCFGTSYFK
jgi:hypothetical protein